MERLGKESEATIITRSICIMLSCVQVFNAILKRQTMANLAKDMDTWIEKRDRLSRRVDELKKQKELVLKSEVCTYVHDHPSLYWPIRLLRSIQICRKVLIACLFIDLHFYSKFVSSSYKCMLHTSGSVASVIYSPGACCVWLNVSVSYLIDHVLFCSVSKPKKLRPLKMIWTLFQLILITCKRTSLNCKTIWLQWMMLSQRGILWRPILLSPLLL